MAETADFEPAYTGLQPDAFPSMLSLDNVLATLGTEGNRA
jgi:hypothetical protein